MDKLTATKLRIVDILNVPERGITLAVVEIVSGEPVFGMLFSVPGSPGMWRHIGNPYISADSVADPQREKTFIALEPVGSPGELQEHLHLVEVTT